MSIEAQAYLLFGAPAFGDLEQQILRALEDGLRCGEMIGLEWGDVDLVKRQTCIQRSEWH